MTGPTIQRPESPTCTQQPHDLARNRRTTITRTYIALPDTNSLHTFLPRQDTIDHSPPLAPRFSR